MNKSVRIAIIAALALVFVGAILIREGQRRSAARVESSAASDGGAAVSSHAQEGGQTATGPLPRLVDLGSTTCVPCKMMAPILEELRREYQGQLAVDVIDVRTNRAAAELYGIRVIPTQIFIDAMGKERFRHEGFMAKGVILAKWSELGVKLTSAAPAAASQAG
jgi:thioredoxin 1